MKALSILAAAVPLILAGTSRAAVDPAIIPDNAHWVVYADLNTLRTTAVGKELVALLEQAHVQPDQPISIDLPKVLTTVGTLTAYGTNFESDPQKLDGTLVAQGTPDLRKITESLLLQQTIAHPDVVAEVTDLGFPAYSIRQKHGKSEEGSELIVAYPPEGEVLVSKSRTQLLKARDLMRGTGNSVAKSADAPLKELLRTSRGAFVFATSVVPSDTNFPEDQPQARILKMTHAGSIAVGEDGPKTFAHAELVAESDETAEKLEKILQGMTALVSLTETSDKQLSEFLNSATVVRHDTTVTLNLAYDSARLAQMVHTLAQQQSERKHHRMQEAEVARPAHVVNGKLLASWQAEAITGDNPPMAIKTHTIDDVALKTGALITLGRQFNGGRAVRFDEVEIVPAGGGAPLSFRAEFMRSGGRGGNQAMFQFPGVAGTYTLKVSYVNDPDGKATYDVSLRQPKSAEAKSSENAESDHGESKPTPPDSK